MIFEKSLYGSLKLLLRSSRILNFLAKIFKDLSFSKILKDPVKFFIIADKGGKNCKEERRKNFYSDPLPLLHQHFPAGCIIQELNNYFHNSCWWCN